MLITKRAASLLFALLASASADSIDRNLAGRGSINGDGANSVATPITVDGDMSEWSQADKFADMHKQGNDDSTWNGYQLAAVAYKRVDCEKKRLCILVVGEPNIVVEPSTDNAWFKDYNSGLPGDKYVGDPGIVFMKSGSKNIGWEGCFTIPDVAMADPSREQIEIHVNYKSGNSATWNTGSTGKAQHGYTLMDLCTINESAPIAPVPAPVAPVPSPVAPVPAPVAPVPAPVAPVPAPVAPVPAPIAPVPAPVNLGPADQNGEPGSSPVTPANQGGGYGDPHLKTWHGKVFDFHGECDLLLTKSERFHNDLGFEIQIRTQIRRDWSFIKEAALRIGNQVFEVSKDMVYHSNLVTHGFRRRGINHLGGHDGVLPQTIAGFPISYVNYDSKRHKFEVDMGEYGTVAFKIYGEFLSVTVNHGSEDFNDAVGLMGDFQTGELKGRDGNVVTDTDVFGVEWQVRGSDNKLFTELHGIQFPEQCKMPPAEAIARRRLAESSVSYLEATKACGGIEEESKDACIFDILATGDLGMAEADL